MKSRMKRIMTACLVSAFTCLIISSCSPATQQSEESTAEALIIKEAGWDADGNTLQFCVGVQNPNKYFNVAASRVLINGKDKHGTTVFSDTVDGDSIFPEETRYICGSLTSEKEIETIEFHAEIAEGEWIDHARLDNGGSAIEVFSVRDTAVRMNGVDAVFSGSILVLAKLTPEPETATVSAVLRDGEGRIITGYSTMTGALHSRGQRLSFEIPAEAIPEFSSFEIHVSPRIQFAVQ